MPWIGAASSAASRARRLAPRVARVAAERRSAVGRRELARPDALGRRVGRPRVEQHDRALKRVAAAARLDKRQKPQVVRPRHRVRRRAVESQHAARHRGHRRHAPRASARSDHTHVGRAPPNRRADRARGPSSGSARRRPRRLFVHVGVRLDVPPAAPSTRRGRPRRRVPPGRDDSACSIGARGASAAKHAWPSPPATAASWHRPSARRVEGRCRRRAAVEAGHHGCGEVARSRRSRRLSRLLPVALCTLAAPPRSPPSSSPRLA